MDDAIPDDTAKRTDQSVVETQFVPPEWHLRELARRVAAADADPGAFEPWEAVYARLLADRPTV